MNFNLGPAIEQVTQANLLLTMVVNRMAILETETIVLAPMVVTTTMMAIMVIGESRTVGMGHGVSGPVPESNTEKGSNQSVDRSSKEAEGGNKPNLPLTRTSETQGDPTSSDRGFPA